MSDLPTESKPLYVPPLEEAAKALEVGLSKNFKNVHVNVVECPNLTAPPFGLAGVGLCGSPRIADIGGVPYLVPKPKLDKQYNLCDIAKLIELPNAFIIGAGAGPHQFVGVNNEMMANVVTGIHQKNGTRIAKCDSSNSGYKLETLPDNEMGCSLLANIFASKGEPGKVLHVKVSNRTVEENLVSCLRNSLKTHFQDKSIGLGGAFLLVKGTAKCHVMPTFSENPLNSNEDVNNWLKFFDMPAPMVFLSVCMTQDPGLDLRVEHTHGFGVECGGHYHYDVTPNEVEYEGYFNFADVIYRIDRPSVTHLVGRD